MSLSLKKVALVYNRDIEGAQLLAQEIAKRFQSSIVCSPDNIPSDCTFVMVVGGDGTLLKCARHCCNYSIPVFGFNMGRLGFLAQAMPNEIDFVIDKIKNGDFRIENRTMLYCPTTNSLALNDMVIKGAAFSRTSTLNLFINGIKLCSYLADGLIISTPTGSTAYALSAGGPIISPELECFVVVPICPHTLNARPIVVPSKEKINITATEAPEEFKIAADGQEAKIVKDGVCFEKHKKYARVLLLNSQDKHFYDVLRDKLHWGMAPNK